MKPAPFHYVRAESVCGAVTTLAESGGSARLIAGGQSLLPLMYVRALRPGLLVDLADLQDELRFIHVRGDAIEIGALATHRDAVDSAALRDPVPLIPELACRIGTPAIRNRGTLGGSLAHGDPVAEWASAGLLLNARYTVHGPTATREISAAELHVDYLRTTLAADEMITSASYERQPTDAGYAVEEVRRTSGSGLLGGVAVLVRVAAGAVADLRIGLLGLADRPVRAWEVEQQLLGLAADGAVAACAARSIGRWLGPMAHTKVPDGFRRRLATNLTRRAVALALSRAEAIA